MDQKIIIAKNLTELRKQAKLTQQELAEKLNYTDKAVSKWERGEALPDIIVLKQLADMYGVKVDDFLYEHTQPVTPQTPVYKKRKIANRLLVALLSAGLVWLVATVIVVFTLLFIPKFTEIFLAYLVAVPVTAIVLLVFNVMWGKRYVSAILVSVLVWSLCCTIDVLIGVPNSWLLYIIGGVLQLLVILWFLLQHIRSKMKSDTAVK